MWLVLASLTACGDDEGGSTAKALTSFGFAVANNAGLGADVTATITGNAVAATVPLGTNVTHLVAQFETTGTKVMAGGVEQRSGVTANDFTSPVTYRVSAGDGSFRDFKVTVTVMKSSAKELTAFSFLKASNAALGADVTATINGTSIAATVPFGTSVTALVATFTSTGASVKIGSATQTSGTTANNFTNPVIYRVTAGDGSTKDYTVTVTIAPSTAKDLTAFSFTAAANNTVLSADVVATINGTAIAATVPFGTNVSALVATFATTGASVTVGGTPQVSDMTPNNFANPVVYRVTAADASTKDYTVTVTIALSPAKDITSFKFLAANNPGLTTDVTATITAPSITATVPFGPNLDALVATFETTGASVKIGGVTQESGVTANSFTASLTYTVIAADGSTKDYIVIVTSGCQVLADPTNGTVSVTNGGVFPSTATYTCNAGFAPLGTLTRTCASNGTWSGAAPTCNAASVMVVRVGDGGAALSTSSTAVFVEQRSVTDGSVTQTIPLPTATTPFTLSGTATSEGALSRSVNGRYVTLAGFAAAPGAMMIASTPNVTAGSATNRVVARVDAAGVVDASTLMFNAFSTSDVRSATSVDGSSFWVAGTSGGSPATGGVHVVDFANTGATTRIVSAQDNVRWVNVFDGQLYVTSNAGGAANIGLLQVGTGLPITATTATLLATPANAYGFALFDRNPVVVGPDVFYVAIDANPGTNRVNVQKWTFDGLAWTQDAAFRPALTSTGLGARGLAAWLDAAGVHVVATTNETLPTPNHLVSFVDDGSTSTPAVTTLATAAANTAFRGVALAPVP